MVSINNTEVPFNRELSPNCSKCAVLVILTFEGIWCRHGCCSCFYHRRVKMLNSLQVWFTNILLLQNLVDNSRYLCILVIVQNMMLYLYVAEEEQTPLKILNYSDAMCVELQLHAWMSHNELTQLWCKRKKMYISPFNPHEHGHPSKLLMICYKKISSCSVSITKQSFKPLAQLVQVSSLHYTEIHCSSFLIMHKEAYIHLTFVLFVFSFNQLYECTHTFIREEGSFAYCREDTTVVVASHKYSQYPLQQSKEEHFKTQVTAVIFLSPHNYCSF